MSIFTRTRDIVAANVTDLLSRSDDPARTIRIMILEMEEALVEVRAAAARGIADMKERRVQVARIASAQDAWTERAELALSRGRDDLARAALIEKDKLSGLAAELAAEAAEIEARLRSWEGDIRKLEMKLREARARQTSIATRMEGAEARIRMREAYAGARTAEAFANFDRLELEADLMEGQAEALALAAPRSLEEEIAELKVNERVEAELAALKARATRAIAA